MSQKTTPTPVRPWTLNGLSEPLIVLSRREVLDLLTLHDRIGAVEGAFRLHAEGRTLGPYEKARATGRGTEVKLDG